MTAGKARGLYEELLTESAVRVVEELEELAVVSGLRASEAAEVIARHLRRYLERALGSVPKDRRPQAQVELANRLLGVVRQSEVTAKFWEDGDRITASVLRGIRGGPQEGLPVRPLVPLSESALYVNARREERLGAALEREIASADAIDLICAFVFWEGYRELRAALGAFLARGGRMRVITTTYRGMTEARVLEELVERGARVKVSYNTMATRLHAKAWYLGRTSGFSTAFVGSSNLSKTALAPGLEWNVRLSAVENPDVMAEFAATFDNYWSDPEFEAFEPTRFAEETNLQRPDDRLLSVFELRARPFQQEILDRLRTEREVHDRHRNLVVAATGTGKTVVAALDYRQLCERDGGRPSLLFVAHRKEILRQARDKFRHAMSDPSFGDLLVDGRTPRDWTHVFASVQSLANVDVGAWDRDRYEVLIVDEFHHAEARTYRRVLELKPRELLGLTATPERADGVSVVRWFEDRVAAEIRLWDAIDRGFLVPFHYYAVADSVDLDTVTWKKGAYDRRELTNLFTGNDARTHLVLQSVRDHVGDVGKMRALGFCVSVEHAEAMAEAFARAGLSSVAVTGGTHKKARARAIRDLQDGKLRCVFTVDVFNEGVDIPEADTLLFLRPTESAVLFLQQLGRGLRRAGGKRCLTVLDFVGRAHRKFRYDTKLRALSGPAGRQRLQRRVEEGFPFLPSGCVIKLDRHSRDHILENLRQGIGHDKRSLLAELRDLPPTTTLAQFLRETELELTDVYRNQRTWSELKRAAGHPQPPRGPDAVAKTLDFGVGTLIHVDDRLRIRTWLAWLTGERPPGPVRSERERRLRLMLATNLLDLEAGGDPDAALGQLWEHPAILAELLELLRLRDEALEHGVIPFRPHGEMPFAVHARYRLSEIMAGLGDVRQGRLYRPRGVGVHYDARSKTNVLMVTLVKDEANRKASTMYRDYAITPRRFHWESQSGTGPTHTKGKRHVEHEALGVTPLLFVRETAKDERGEAAPYTLLGPVRLESAEGERPMKIVWGLDLAMPAELFRVAAVAR